MRWYSLNGVPRGSKNGSGASIRMRAWGCTLLERPERIGAWTGVSTGFEGERIICLARYIGGHSGRRSPDFWCPARARDAVSPISWIG